MYNYLIISNYGFGEIEVYGMVKAESKLQMEEFYKEYLKHTCDDDEVWRQISMANNICPFLEFITKYKGLKIVEYEQFDA